MGKYESSQPEQDVHGGQSNNHDDSEDDSKVGNKKQASKTSRKPTGEEDNSG